MKKIAIFLTLIICVSLFFTKVYASSQLSPYSLKSQTAVLIDAETGNVLFDKNMNKKMYPASITKIMTVLLAIEKADMASVMTTSRNAVFSLPYNSSHIALDAQENITMEQALYAIGIESANDASNVVAEYLAGTTENFATQMTERAGQLGANNTNFTNPHGLPDKNHYTTAYDMALITAEAIKRPDLIKFFSTKRYDMPATNKRSEVRQFWNANDFINGNRPYDGIIMSKTGWTQESEHTLVTVCERNGIKLIAVVMYSEEKRDKYDDTKKLFDYGFENYYRLNISSDEIVARTPKTINCSDGTQAVLEEGSVFGEGMSVLVPNGVTAEKLTYKFEEPNFNESKNHAIIKMNVYYNDNIVGSQNLSAIFDIKVRSNRWIITLKKVFYFLVRIVLWMILILLFLLILKQLVIIENRRRRKLRQKERARRAKNRAINRENINYKYRY